MVQEVFALPQELLLNESAKKNASLLPIIGLTLIRVLELLVALSCANLLETQKTALPVLALLIQALEFAATVVQSQTMKLVKSAGFLRYVT